MIHTGNNNSSNFEMGPGDSEAVECKCGMPLCICVVAPPKTSNPQVIQISMH